MLERRKAGCNFHRTTVSLQSESTLASRSDGGSRRKATVADRDRERRKWAGKRALPSDIYRRGLRPKNAFIGTQQTMAKRGLQSLKSTFGRWE